MRRGCYSDMDGDIGYTVTMYCLHLRRVGAVLIVIHTHSHCSLSLSLAGSDSGSVSGTRRPSLWNQTLGSEHWPAKGSQGG